LRCTRASTSMVQDTTAAGWRMSSTHCINETARAKTPPTVSLVAAASPQASPEIEPNGQALDACFPDTTSTGSSSGNVAAATTAAPPAVASSQSQAPPKKAAAAAIHAKLIAVTFSCDGDDTCTTTAGTASCSPNRDPASASSASGTTGTSPPLRGHGGTSANGHASLETWEVDKMDGGRVSPPAAGAAAAFANVGPLFDGGLKSSPSKTRGSDSGAPDRSVVDKAPHGPLSHAATSDATRTQSRRRDRRRKQAAKTAAVNTSMSRLSKRSFESKRRQRNDTDIPPFPMPSMKERGGNDNDDIDNGDNSGDDDGAVIFHSPSSRDEQDGGGGYHYAMDDDDGDSSIDSGSTANSRLDELLGKYFPDESGGQGTVTSAPSSPRGKAPGSPHYREVQKVWAERALSNPLLRGGSLPSLSPPRSSYASFDDTVSRELSLLDDAPPMPQSLRQKSVPRLRLTPRRSKRHVAKGHYIEEALPPSPGKDAPVFELTRSLSEGSALEYSHDMSSGIPCFPRVYHDALKTSNTIQHWVKCEVADGSGRPLPGCCNSSRDQGLDGGDFASLLKRCMPDFSLQTADSAVGETVLTPNPIEPSAKEGVDSSCSLSPSSAQVASSPESQGSRSSRKHTSVHDRSVSLATSVWLEDVHRQYHIKEQNRSRMIAAMAKAARAHSQLASDNNESDTDSNSFDDVGLASRSLDFDDLGQLGGFGITKGGKRERANKGPDSSTTVAPSPDVLNSTLNGASVSARGDSKSSSNTADMLSDSDSEEELNVDLLAERDLVRRARQMREEIRRAEMAELAREAERAAAAGEAKFVGAASTFDVVLAASAAASKHTGAIDAGTKSKKNSDIQKRPWECMFDSKTCFENSSWKDSQGKDTLSSGMTPPSSPMKEWVKTTLAAPPSSPMAEWVSTAMALYDPLTPVERNRTVQSTRERKLYYSPSALSRGSVPESIKRRSNSITDAYHPTTPLRRAATSRTEATITSSRLMSALSTPLSDRKKISKVPVLQLRNIEDIVPAFGEIHLRLRTDMAGKGVSKAILGGTTPSTNANGTGDHMSPIGSDGSGSSFQHIASSLGNLLKSATFASNRQSDKAMSSMGSIGEGGQTDIRAPSPCGLPPIGRPPMCRTSAAEMSVRHITRLSGMSLDCTRVLRIDDEDEARAILREQLGEWSDSDHGDDKSTGSHDSSSTTDLYVSALTSELHTPRPATRKQKKKITDSSRAPPIDDSFIFPQPAISTPTKIDSGRGISSGSPLEDLSIPDAMLSINTPRGGARTYSRRESDTFEESVGVLSINTPSGGKRLFTRTNEGEIVETRAIGQSRSNHTDDLTLPDLGCSNSLDEDNTSDQISPRSAVSGATSRLSDPVSEGRGKTMISTTAHHMTQRTPNHLGRPSFSGYSRDGGSAAGQEESVLGQVAPVPSHSFDADVMYWDSDVDSEGSPGAAGSTTLCVPLTTPDALPDSKVPGRARFHGGTGDDNTSLYPSVLEHLGFRLVDVEVRVSTMYLEVFRTLEFATEE